MQPTRKRQSTKPMSSVLKLSRRQVAYGLAGLLMSPWISRASGRRPTTFHPSQLPGLSFAIMYPAQTLSGAVVLLADGLISAAIVTAQAQRFCRAGCLVAVTRFAGWAGHDDQGLTNRDLRRVAAAIDATIEYLRTYLPRRQIATLVSWSLGGHEFLGLSAITSADRLIIRYSWSPWSEIEADTRVGSQQMERALEFLDETLTALYADGRPFKLLLQGHDPQRIMDFDELIEGSHPSNG